MPGSGGRGRPAASQVWRAELHGVAPLALLATKPRGLRSPSGTRTGKTLVNGICVAKDHYQPCAPRSPKVRAMAWRRLRPWRSFCARSFSAALAIALLLATLCQSQAVDPKPKLVVMLHSFGLRFKP